MTPSARLTAIARASAQRRSVADMRRPEPIDIDDCREVYGEVDPNTLTFNMDDLDDGEGK